jgi:hypothetical protein
MNLAFSLDLIEIEMDKRFAATVFVACRRLPKSEAGLGLEVVRSGRADMQRRARKMG